LHFKTFRSFLTPSKDTLSRFYIKLSPLFTRNIHIRNIHIRWMSKPSQTRVVHTFFATYLSSVARGDMLIKKHVIFIASAQKFLASLLFSLSTLFFQLLSYLLFPLHYYVVMSCVLWSVFWSHITYTTPWTLNL